MGPVVGALVSGGIKLLGGLIGNKSRKKQEARAKQDAQDALWEQRSYDRVLTNEMRNWDSWQLDKARAYDADAPARNIRSQMAGIQEAALTTGFNPLTLLAGANTGSGGSSIGGSSGFASGASIGSTPPLASIDIATGALQDFGDIVTGEVSRRAAANKLEMDLGQLKLDQLRSGVVAFAPSATAAVGDGLPALGRRAATVLPSAYASGMAGVPSRISTASGKIDIPRQVLPQEYITNNGEKVRVPVGPDLDEIVSGVVIESIGRAKGAYKSARSYLDTLGPHGPKRPSQQSIGESNPWKRVYSRMSWPAGSPTFKNF